MNIERIVNFQIMLYDLKKFETNLMNKSTDNSEQNLNTLLYKDVEKKEQVKNNNYDEGTHVHSRFKKRTAIS